MKKLILSEGDKIHEKIYSGYYPPGKWIQVNSRELKKKGLPSTCVCGVMVFDVNSASKSTVGVLFSCSFAICITVWIISSLKLFGTEFSASANVSLSDESVIRRLGATVRCTTKSYIRSEMPTINPPATASAKWVSASSPLSFLVTSSTFLSSPATILANTNKSASKGFDGVFSKISYKYQKNENHSNTISVYMAWSIVII